MIHPENLQTNCDWSPYEGMCLKGYPETTICRGKIIVEKNKFVGTPGYGKFLRRKTGGKI
ncbi:MAG: D-hydantoinase [bacterium ADurb.Bin363]|nr:MAG: D-hydantoinase [bacterium ADurb.Bin363]